LSKIPTFGKTLKKNPKNEFLNISMENQGERKTLKKKIDLIVKDPIEQIQILDDMNPQKYCNGESNESIIEFEKVIYIF